MPRKTNPLDQASDSSDAPTLAGNAIRSGLTPEQLGRLAQLVADGRSEFPMELEQVDRDRLVVEVRHRLRKRLFRLIARALASQWHREAGLFPKE